jgi:hypothetical protein
MHVITRKRLNEFAREHRDAQSALEHWYRVMKTPPVRQLRPVARNVPQRRPGGQQDGLQHWRQLVPSHRRDPL